LGGIDAKRVRKQCADEFDIDRVKGVAKLAEFLFRRATSEGLRAGTAAILVKMRGGWVVPQFEN
jgi:hypothetical protein